MIQLSDTNFNRIVVQAIDAIPAPYGENIHNLVFVVEERPTPEQHQKLRLRANETLFGLYEGIPLTQRSAGYNLVLPDKITIFKMPLEMASRNVHDLAKQVKHTVWHEVAHYFGLDHQRIYELEQRL